MRLVIHSLMTILLKISIDILPTTLYTFPKVLRRRTCLAIRGLFGW